MKTEEKTVYPKFQIDFRDLTAEDVECRVAMCRQNGVSLLIYKDARTDQNILDETVGCMNWRKTYEQIGTKTFCTISIWDPEKKEWVSKTDLGSESNTEKEKGEASDGQKRACVVWGIGRELYTAPFIWVKSDKCEIVNNNGKFQCKTVFEVTHMKVENKKIVELSIANSRTGEVVYQMGKQTQTAPAAKPVTAPKEVKQAAPSNVVNTVQDAEKVAEELTSEPKKKPNLKDFLAAKFKTKSGKEISLQDSINLCKDENAKKNFLKFLKEQVNNNNVPAEFREACKMVYLANSKGLVAFPS